jgi:GGDEF domain-containing protein
MKNQWMKDCLVIYIDNDIFKTINNKKNHATISKYEDLSITTE